MIILKTVGIAGIAALSLMAVLPAQAATATMTQNFKSGTVYATNTESLGLFTTTYKDYVKGSFLGTRQPRITSLSYRWSSYTNGQTKEEVRLCFRSWQQINFSKCVDVTNVKSRTIDDFNNVDFKYGASFGIYHKLIGGKYPAFRPETGDSITINYSYDN
jgi:hypothetical protein